MSSQHRRRIAALLKLSGAPELDPAAVEQAFVHESASSEGAGPSNQRLEFFGDAILGFLTSRWLWARYPEAGEGELSRRRASIVSGDACAQSARRLDLGEIVRFGVGMQQDGGATNTSVLADVFEAYLGALYLQTDIERVARFLETHHFAHVDHADAAESDAKTALQEFTQARFAVALRCFARVAAATTLVAARSSASTSVHSIAAGAAVLSIFLSVSVFPIPFCHNDSILHQFAARRKDFWCHDFDASAHDKIFAQHLVKSDRIG